MSLVGIRIVHHRIALEFVFVVAHFDAVDGDQLLRVGIVVAADRFEQVLAVEHHPAVGEFADVLLRVEQEFIGVERGVAVDDLDDVGVDPRLVQLAVVLLLMSTLPKNSMRMSE